VIRTERLSLREWRDADLAPFAALNADPEVARYLPAPLSRAESDALAARIRAGLAARPYGLWAVEIPGEAPFIGFVGLAPVSFEARFTPCVEVGWRLSRAHWGKGYASEAARAALAHGFGAVGLDAIVSFTTRENRASRRVMERLGMRRDPAEDFEHPRLPPGHPLRPHVLYRLSREEWLAAAEAAARRTRSVDPSDAVPGGPALRSRPPPHPRRPAVAKPCRHSPKQEPRQPYPRKPLRHRQRRPPGPAAPAPPRGAAASRAEGAARSEPQASGVPRRR
jgi:RimJ/RimL family protein N-acetyltransferase